MLIAAFLASLVCQILVSGWRCVKILQLFFLWLLKGKIQFFFYFFLFWDNPGGILLKLFFEFPGEDFLLKYFLNFFGEDFYFWGGFFYEIFF